MSLEFDKEYKLFENNKCFKYRSFLKGFLNKTPEIRDIMIKEHNSTSECDIQFSVKSSDIGLFLEKSFMCSGNKILSRFILNFIGEFLIRENISEFIPLIKEIPHEIIIDEINFKNHKNFGSSIMSNGYMIFSFHISLLMEILTEDLKYNFS
jgi:hypothetical protein